MMSRFSLSSEPSRRRKLTGAIALIGIAVYLANGIRYAWYRPAISANYIWAVYHVHSDMSDGLASPLEIARQARIARVALVILTDHGNPNSAASAFRLSVDGVTVLGGSEARLPSGRLTFFGAREVPRFSLASFPPQAIDEARLWGAFPIVSYSDDPLYGWHYWEPDLSPDGIELSNLFSSIRALSPLQKFFLALYYPFSPYYFLKDISFPVQSRFRWDTLLERGRTWGMIASDAHGGFHLGKTLSVPVPSYAATFSLAGLGIDKKYTSEPDAAVRNGDFFICIRGAGEPEDAQFFAVHGNSKFPSGSTAPEGSDIYAKIHVAGQPVRLVLVKDGNVERQVDGGFLELSGASSGVYRLEAYLPTHPLLPAQVPWIVSNPIFVGSSRSPAQRPFATSSAPGALPVWMP